MKTKLYPIPVLLAMLPKGIAEKATDNCGKQNITDNSVCFDLREKPSKGLWGAFSWMKTIEGHDYWYSIVKQLEAENL